MNIDRRVVELALEALEMHCSFVTRDKPNAMDAGIEAIAICKQALAEQFCDNHCTWLDHHPECDKAEQPAQQEPVAWLVESKHGNWAPYLEWSEPSYLETQVVTPLYASPPASKPWVGLDQHDIDVLFLNEDGVRFARYIEAKLKEKNQ